MLAGALREQGQTVVLAREPGATALGERVRSLLLDGAGAIAPAAETLLFAAARAQLVADVVRPALEAGAWVVCDRFVDSSLAYQGAARGLGIDAVWAVNELAVAGCLPDLAIVLELPVGTARARKGAPDGRIEEEGAALQERVAEGYRELARRYPERLVLISSDGSPEDVHAAVMARVAALR
jgi:dTMP kinase